MMPSLPVPVELCFHFKPQIRKRYSSTSLLLFTAAVLVLVFCFSNAVSAGSRFAHTSPGADTNSSTNEIKNLPVVKLEQTNPLAQIIEQIDAARVVLVGETHTRYDHHLVQ